MSLRDVFIICIYHCWKFSWCIWCSCCIFILHIRLYVVHSWLMKILLNESTSFISFVIGIACQTYSASMNMIKYNFFDSCGFLSFYEMLFIYILTNAIMWILSVQSLFVFLNCAVNKWRWVFLCSPETCELCNDQCSSSLLPLTKQ